MKLTRRTAVAALGASLASSRVWGASQIRIALFGEQTVHSLHRQNDPEFPQFLGELLDADFKIDPTQHPTGGGMLYGGGSKYRIGSFGHPRGTIIDHALENPKSVLRSEELKLAEAFAPNLVVFGPFGDHEPLTQQPLDRLEPDLRRLISRIAAFPSRPRIFLALPIPRGPTDEDGNYRRLRDEMLALAKQRRLPVIDLWNAFLGHGEYYNDMTHLTLAGRAHMARTVARAIT